MTISGSSLSDASGNISEVVICGVPVVNISYSSAEMVIVTLAPCLACEEQQPAGDVVVNSSCGVVRLTDAFTYEQRMKLFSLTMLFGIIIIV